MTAQQMTATITDKQLNYLLDIVKVKSFLFEKCGVTPSSDQFEVGDEVYFILNPENQTFGRGRVLETLNGRLKIRVYGGRDQWTSPFCLIKSSALKIVHSPSAS